MAFDPGPLQRYLQARDALRDGDPAAAGRLIKEALHVEGAASPLVDNLEKFLDPNSIAGEGMLKLITQETTRRLE